MKLKASAVEYFGHAVDATPDNYGSYRVLADEQAGAVDVELVDLQRLQDILSWRCFTDPGDTESEMLPERIRSRLRETMAYQLMFAWIELRSVDVALAEIGEAFNGADPLRPVLRTKLETTREKLLKVKEHLEFLRLEVVLREPLEEEVQELRDWLASLPKP